MTSNVTQQLALRPGPANITNSLKGHSPVAAKSADGCNASSTSEELPL